MTEILTGKTRMLAVDVVIAINSTESCLQCTIWDNDGLPEDSSMQYDLPSGNWQILGRANEITEEQAKEIVKCTGKTIYKDYANSYMGLSMSVFTALESFQSLLTANNITENQLILIEKR